MNNRLLIGVIMLCSFTVFGQTNQNINVSGNVGLVSLLYNLDKGECNPRTGFGGDVSYSFYFTPQWGIGAGLEFTMGSTNGYLNGAKISFDNQIDDQGDMYRKDIYFRDWHEKQSIFFLEIPIQLQYRYDFGLNKRRMIYINMGVKLQMPLMANYQVTRGELEVQGYYPEWNVTLFGLPNHGFGKETSKSLSGKLQIPINIAATISMGYSFEVSKMINVFVGATFDYGFMNLKGISNGDLLYEDNHKDLQYRGMLYSSSIEKVNTISAKGEAGVSIAIGKPVYKTYYKYR
ncbi:MAG: outer membrane beta-barrel protein [Bacteroidales bacterium]|jgi:hypothetical protein|nr:outer membrane beta-barrel protein [Bacteroidales bacterium]